MPKVKSKRSAQKRFKITGTGKVKRNKAFKSHLLIGKSPKTRRKLRKPALVDKTELKKIKRLMPSSF
ncbi:MAG TPA: 50S ribosomal protein L35 [Candidatus Hydrothermia bacterium]|nr:50S ribosomal protein L35 [Candidatus Hydrothermae bacterium]MDD3649310.1 50S ribosomal protein L35 [Candidatus Hydrothermia bacterium]MDD5573151.1 50S ribosomal protein L35 [Candidatus Hydrothermia bacterium]HOK22725.1 50S ribosomal protein L35 [Candidatus Hydrothermia bacterium]HOL23434.1 50S ribosomal protein L35 [Candidatus Hydrothermia bacterium]